MTFVIFFCTFILEEYLKSVWLFTIFFEMSFYIRYFWIGVSQYSIDQKVKMLVLIDAPIHIQAKAVYNLLIFCRLSNISAETYETKTINVKCCRIPNQRGQRYYTFYLKLNVNEIFGVGLTVDRPMATGKCKLCYQSFAALSMAKNFSDFDRE